MRPILLPLFLAALLAAPGCRRDPTPAPHAHRAVAATVERTGLAPAAGLTLTTPLEYAIRHAPGHLRVTMEVEGTGEPYKAPFLHDALFLLEGDGRLAITFREPTPGREHGRVTIRCGGPESETTVDYEPELWYARPGATARVDIPIPEGKPAPLTLTDQTLAVVEATAPNAPPVRVTLRVAASDRPIKPRVKAGVRAPR